MKKIVSAICLLAFTFALLIPVYAVGAPVVDGARLFTDNEYQNLTQAVTEASQSLDLDVVIVTVDSIEGHSAYNYACEFYIQNGYRDDGILFLLAMEEREWYILTSGYAKNNLNDRELDELGDTILPYLSSGDYYQGFLVYLSSLDAHLNASQPVISHSLKNVELPSNLGRISGISLLIGAAVSAIALAIMRVGMNTKRSNNSAGNYMNERTYNLRIHQDIYLYSNVTKTPKPKNNTGSSSGGSSSGRSFGGRGGKF